MNIFDSHAHVAPTQASVDRLLHRMRESRIAKAAVVAGGTLSCEALSQNMLKVREQDVKIDNLGVKIACESSEDRLLPFYFANPHAGTQEYQTQGNLFYGLKLGPAVHGVALNDERNIRFLELAVKFQHPIYFHCLPQPGFDVEAALGLARRFPQASLILGHAGIGNCDFYALSLIAPFPNLYFETSGGFSAVVQDAVSRLGASRVLFGSEYPIQNPDVELTKIFALTLSEQERCQILETNIARLIRGKA